MRTRLTTIEREFEVVIDGTTFSEVRDVGHVVRAAPLRIQVGGVWFFNHSQVGEFIRLHLDGSAYRWAAPLDDYDPETNTHDPATDSRWEVE